MDLSPSALKTLDFAAHNNPAHLDELDSDSVQFLFGAGLLSKNPKRSGEEPTTFTVTREGQRVLNDNKE